jgi:hypothetical protein
LAVGLPIGFAVFAAFCSKDYDWGAFQVLSAYYPGSALAHGNRKIQRGIEIIDLYCA